MWPVGCRLDATAILRAPTFLILYNHQNKSQLLKSDTTTNVPEIGYRCLEWFLFSVLRVARWGPRAMVSSHEKSQQFTLIFIMLYKMCAVTVF